METVAAAASFTRPTNLNMNLPPRRGQIKVQIIRGWAESLFSAAKRAGDALGIPPPPASPSSPPPGACKNSDHLSTLISDAASFSPTSIPFKSQISKGLAESFISAASVAAQTLCGSGLKKEKKAEAASAIIHPET